MSAFRIGINMPGAISAGAYTAGVLDFLIEALDSWYAAKDAFSKGQGDAVPMHEVELPVFSGASAGGMCAAIASMLVQGQFQHIHSTELSSEETTNRFFESWVNMIDIRGLLQADDLRNGGPVFSLLNCTIIDQIAEAALKPNPAAARKYIPENLTLFLTLTNLTGIPYALTSQGNVPSLEENTLYHADRLRFETVTGDRATGDPTAKALHLDNMGHECWEDLRTAAKATGAFPIFLAPRAIMREKADYARPLWESVNPHATSKSDPPIRPMWPEGMPDRFMTINVDGGVIDNDPFNLSHDYLASLPPVNENNQNQPLPDKADRAVVTVSPFPSRMNFNADARYEEEAEVGKALASLASTLIASSRFFGESLAKIADGTSSRFMIAPSDESKGGGQTPKHEALQCGSLGAFGGFFEKKFRRHDYQLGRRNCQQFLRAHFSLPTVNPIIAGGLPASAEARKTMLKRYGVNPPSDDVSHWADWISVVPLCGAMAKEEPLPAREKISEFALRDIVDLMYERFGKLEPLLTHKIAFGIRVPLEIAEKFSTIFGLGKEKVYELLRKELGDSAE